MSKLAKSMTLAAILFHEKFIIYRPLLHLAFIGNRAMAGLARRIAKGSDQDVGKSEKEAFLFLKRIGLLKADPPPPAPPETLYQPRAAVLLATNRCSFRCVYCYAAAGEKKPQDMPVALGLKGIDIAARNARKMKESHFELIFHGGGEPVEHWELVTKAIAHARRKPVKCLVSMSSNGYWTPSQRSYLLDHLNGLSLSFDGTQEVQDTQRPLRDGRGSFRSVVKTIRALDKRKFPYNVRLTTTLRWMEKLPDCIRFLCEETGVRNMQVEPAFNTGRTGWQEPSARDAGRFIDAFIRSMDVAVKHKRELTFSGARPWLTVCSFCSAGTSALVIRPDGRLVSCYEVTDSRHKLAPIFTIGRIGPEGLELDEMAKSRLAEMNKQRLQSCRNCFCLWHCGGDCAARSYSSDLRAHLKHGRRCRINREISREILARFIEDCGGLWKADVKIEKTHEKRT